MLIEAADAEHYLFPWDGREQKIDPINLFLTQ
jgi:hypothetical protein